MANSLLAGFTEICGPDIIFTNVTFSQSCSPVGGNFQKLENLHSVHVNLFDYCKWYCKILGSVTKI